MNTMNKMILVTGFARGGTSWLRDCIGSHPNIAVLPRERVVFRDMTDPDEIRAYFERETTEFRDGVRFIVNKAPANAPYVGKAARDFPDSRFIFIIRDPRDVLVSHQRGTQAWMRGYNSTVEGCISKIQKYYEGWLDAQNLPNVMLVRYEDIHQNFFPTMERIFGFIEVDGSPEILLHIFNTNSFQAQTKRSNVEDPSSAKRKGVIGEWAVHLNPKEIDRYKESDFFTDFMAHHGYNWTMNVYRDIVTAMYEAGMHFLSEEALLARRLNPKCPNVVLQHDIDYLHKPWCAKSVEQTARIESQLGIPAGYNFLPLDDRRYGAKGGRLVLDLIKRIYSINVSAYVGLHVNACERFYPASAPNVGADSAALEEVRACLHSQVKEYQNAGIDFRIATAHGYGRGKKLPNNRDTPLIEEELAAYGIALFDRAIRPKLIASASHSCAITDVGGILKARRLRTGHALTDPRAYAALPPGSFLRFLTHPGNYAVDKPSTLAMRVFA